MQLLTPVYQFMTLLWSWGKALAEAEVAHGGEQLVIVVNSLCILRATWCIICSVKQTVVFTRIVASEISVWHCISEREAVFSYLFSQACSCLAGVLFQVIPVHATASFKSWPSCCNCGGGWVEGGGGVGGSYRGCYRPSSFEALGKPTYWILVAWMYVIE